MKTILFNNRVKLNVNDKVYRFWANDFLQKSDIQDMKKGDELSLFQGLRYLKISQLTNKEVDWFIDIANLNDFYDYRIINII